MSVLREYKFQVMDRFENGLICVFTITAETRSTIMANIRFSSSFLIKLLLITVDKVLKLVIFYSRCPLRVQNVDI